MSGNAVTIGCKSSQSVSRIGAKIAQLSREIFAIVGDCAFTEGALTVNVRRFPLAQRSRMASRAVVRKVTTGGSPLTPSRP